MAITGYAVGPGAQIAKACFSLLSMLFILCAYTAFMTKLREGFCRLSFGYTSLEVHGKKPLMRSYPGIMHYFPSIKRQTDRQTDRQKERKNAVLQSVKKTGGYLKFLGRALLVKELKL